MSRCGCHAAHAPRRIVITGGPGAGKTALLELVRRAMCRHVRVLPEAAGIVFGGGFPRNHDTALLRAAQRAIFYVQRELEATATGDLALVLCDRGTVDGAAYWPGPGELWDAVGTALDEQLARYDVVLHLRTPPPNGGYDRSNPLRIETPAEAAAIDERIALAWARHPRRFELPATADFMQKVRRALEVLQTELPPCCRSPATAALALV